MSTAYAEDLNNVADYLGKCMTPEKASDCLIRLSKNSDVLGRVSRSLSYSRMCRTRVNRSYERFEKLEIIRKKKWWNPIAKTKIREVQLKLLIHAELWMEQEKLVTRYFNTKGPFVGEFFSK